MANPRTSTPQDPRRTARQGQSRTQGQDQDENRNRDDRDDGDGVEIGDPVPERERTIRATRGGQGETGEDEDLPDDDGGIEGTSTERH